MRSTDAGTRACLLALCLLVGCRERGASVAGPSRPPSFVLIVSDDQDPTHFGFLGHPVVGTPALDSLANEGTVFRSAYTEARCRPTHAGLLTGRWPQQHGVYYNHGARQLEATPTLPSLLRDAGYETFLQGKYWEGDPARLGFTGGPGDDPDLIRRDQKATLRFLREVKDRPFLLWYAPRLPHLPHDPPPALRDRYADADVPVPDWLSAEERDQYRQLERNSYAMVSWLDDGVQVLLDELDAQGHRDHTLVVFLIDNGWSYAHVSKGSAFDRGVRTPLVFRGPSVRSGQTSDALVSYLDVMPTLLDYAGVAIPEACEGRSLRPLLEGRETPWRDVLCGAVFASVPGPELRPEQDVFALFARTDRYKYVRTVRDVRPEDNRDSLRILHVLEEFPARARGAQELYDLVEDPDERHDLAGQAEQRERVERLHAEVLEWWRRTGGGALDLP